VFTAMSSDPGDVSLEAATEAIGTDESGGWAFARAIGSSTAEGIALIDCSKGWADVGVSAASS